MESEYLTIKEASVFLKTTVNNLYNMTHERRIPHIKRGRLYFKVSDLEKWLESGRREVSE
jgi:excisionase family DNA binding protein